MKPILIFMTALVLLNCKSDKKAPSEEAPVSAEPTAPAESEPPTAAPADASVEAAMQTVTAPATLTSPVRVDATYVTTPANVEGEALAHYTPKVILTGANGEKFEHVVEGTKIMWPESVGAVEWKNPELATMSQQDTLSEKAALCDGRFHAGSADDFCVDIDGDTLAVMHLVGSEGDTAEPTWKRIAEIKLPAGSKAFHPGVGD